MAIDALAHFYAGIGHMDAVGHELVELDPGGHRAGLWSTGGETLAVDLAGSVIYQASDGEAGWPPASPQKYALP